MGNSASLCRKDNLRDYEGDQIHRLPCFENMQFCTSEDCPSSVRPRTAQSKKLIIAVQKRIKRECDRNQKNHKNYLKLLLYKIRKK